MTWQEWPFRIQMEARNTLVSATKKILLDDLGRTGAKSHANDSMPNGRSDVLAVPPLERPHADPTRWSREKPLHVIPYLKERGGSRSWEHVFRGG